MSSLSGCEAWILPRAMEFRIDGFEMYSIYGRLLKISWMQKIMNVEFFTKINAKNIAASGTNPHLLAFGAGVLTIETTTAGYLSLHFRLSYSTLQCFNLLQKSTLRTDRPSLNDRISTPLPGFSISSTIIIWWRCSCYFSQRVGRNQKVVLHIIKEAKMGYL